MLRRPTSKHESRGETLVEVAVTIAIFAVALPLVFGGLFSAIRSSRVADKISKTEAVLARASERIGGTAYVPCPQQGSTNAYLPVVQSAAAAVGWEPSSITISSVKYWNPATGSWGNTNLLRGTECTAPGPASSRALQLITVTVTGEFPGPARSLEIVKSNVVPRETPT